MYACQPAHKKDEIETAIKRYDRLLLNVDADSIALMFTPDGKLDEMAQGQDSIRKFLLSFKDVKVLSTGFDKLFY